MRREQPLFTVCVDVNPKKKDTRSQNRHKEKKKKVTRKLEIANSAIKTIELENTNKAV